MKAAALCAGYGGLELGLSLAGLDVELEWYAEIDVHASQVMAYHHPDVPNLGDLTKIDDAPPVEIVTAGFPCQPVSLAGQRKGVNDERWLIDDVCRVARRTGADWLVLENVSGLLSASGGDAMARVVAALAANGFAAEWTSVRASDVGAPHQRLRWFCVAYSDSNRGDQLPTETDDASRFVPVGNGEERRVAVAGTGAAAPDAEGAERGGTQSELLNASVGSAAELGERFRAVADRWGPYADAIARWEPIVGRIAPEPTDDKRRLNPRFVEWMMGLPDGWVCDAVEGRSHQLRILGNGVVPQQAALALGLLFEQIGEDV